MNLTKQQMDYLQTETVEFEEELNDLYELGYHIFINQLSNEEIDHAADSYLCELENQTDENPDFSLYSPDEYCIEQRYIWGIQDYNRSIDNFVEKFGRNPEKGEVPEIDRDFNDLKWYGNLLLEEYENLLSEEFGILTIGIHQELKKMMGWKCFLYRSNGSCFGMLI